MKACGLAGVQLAVSDAHTGLKQAITAVLIGTSWDRVEALPGPQAAALRTDFGLIGRQ